MRLFLWSLTLFAKMWTVSLFIFFYLKITEVFNKLPVIRVKEESQNGCHKKTKHAKFSEKRTFPLRYAQGGQKCLFSRKFIILWLFVTPVLRFTILAYSWIVGSKDNHFTWVVSFPFAKPTFRQQRDLQTIIFWQA